MLPERAQTLAKVEMAKWDLHKHGWTFAFNRRRTALGLCDPRKRTIFLSHFYLDKVSEVQILDTIRHEIAHALEFVRYGDSSHGPRWKQVCVEVGAKPERLYKGPISHAYPYVVKYEGQIVRGFYKKPNNVHLMQVKGRPETRGLLKLYRVTYTKV